MLAIVFLVLALGILATVILCSALFLEVAFAPGEREERVDLEPRALPILSGASLRDWGARLAAGIVSNEVARKRDQGAAEAIASNVERAMSAVVSRVFPPVQQPRREWCSSCRHDCVPVTAPEALAIADDLRRRCGSHMIERVRAQARRNSKSAAGDETSCAANFVCPLFGSGGCCIAHAVRPIYCRGRDVACNVLRPGEPAPADDIQKSFTTTLSEGVSSGLRTALKQASYDGQVYELSSALATALELPSASQRWAKGEAIFADCARVDLAW
ncbi:MAG: hypothetical protein HY288_17545 [Planctomycetia bacterium]|nr:hypothetical protein [Planctomycetia bacterium]